MNIYNTFTTSNNFSLIYLFVLKYLNRYGYSTTNNSYFISPDPAITDKVFENFRKIDQATEKPNYPKSIGAYRIKNIRDLTIGYDSSMPDLRPILPVSKDGHMVTLE